jgi:hypothetical protein
MHPRNMDNVAGMYGESGAREPFSLAAADSIDSYVGVYHPPLFEDRCMVG